MYSFTDAEKKELVAMGKMFGHTPILLSENPAKYACSCGWQGMGWLDEKRLKNAFRDWLVHMKDIARDLPKDSS